MIEIKEKRIEKEVIEPRISEFKETDFELRHNTLKEKVKSLLKHDKYARQNDFYLCLLFYIKTGQLKVKEIDFSNFSRTNKPESISRCRRELISLAKKGDKELQFLLKDESTLEQRKEEEQNYKQYYQKQNSGWMAGWVK